ncbi:peroxisomal biogenesis factor 13 isoform X2 [Nomia melanderi]|uniref:peroxisomal biogenesis factor 13 isoform X2 n=1 Tax=Nomia melanderi TaxID=2448451 RepID=UPI0013041C31|nr:peroxisomal membrane protein PEX13-like isoform X2 [Nomia melanderi]
MAPGKSSDNAGNLLRNSPQIASSLTNTPTPFPTVSNQLGNPPPIPPRQPAQNYSGFNDYRLYGSNYYGGYGYGLGNQYRGPSGFGGYSSYGCSPYSNYNNYGMFNNHSGDAENSVAENVGRLRSTLGQLFSTFALIRFVKWLYRKIVRNNGFEHEGSMNEELWKKSLAKIGNENVNTSFWSGFLIFSVFFVIPYMIHKITNNIKNVQVKGKDPKDWYQYDQPVFVATALYDFTASNNEELSLRAGQKLYLAPQALQPKNMPGWCRATDNANVGLIPYNYIKIIGQLKKRNESDVISLNEEKSCTNENYYRNTKENSEI